MNDTFVAPESRMTGRLFLRDGCLHFVLDVDIDAGTARVSCAKNGQRQVFDIPLTDVAERLAGNPNLVLDTHSNNSKPDRIKRRSDGWFFATRGGAQGPFATESEARKALGDYLLAAQSA